MADYKIITGGRTTIVNMETGGTVGDVLLNGTAQRIAANGYFTGNMQIPVASLPASGGGKTYLDLTLIATILLPTPIFSTLDKVKGFATLKVTCDAGVACAVWLSTIPPPNTGASPDDVPPGLFGGTDGGLEGPVVQGNLTPSKTNITPALYVFGKGIDATATNVTISISAVLSPA